MDNLYEENVECDFETYYCRSECCGRCDWWTDNDPASPLDDRTAAKDELQKVIDAIEALPPQMRRAFWLRRVEGWSQREIATELGLSESTVEKHIGRGIKRLLEQFGRGGNRKRAASTSATDVEPQESRPLERPSRVRGST